jgi:hypothetical protein
MRPADSEPSLAEIAQEWGRIGCIGFGGPPAHIALFRVLCVTQREWLTAGPWLVLVLLAGGAVELAWRGLHQDGVSLHAWPLLLNLSSRTERTLHYLDVDSCCVELVANGSYVCAADPRGLADRALTANIPPRRGSHVAGLLFAANLVLHSGVDDASGHFVGAYGVDEVDHYAWADCDAQNAIKTRSRSSLCLAG